MNAIESFRRDLYSTVAGGEKDFLTRGEMAEALRDVADDIEPRDATR